MSSIILYAFISELLALILFVIFGQITVKKLRNIPEMKNQLGIEFASGWDILNVAQALALPKIITNKLQKSSISFLYANADLLKKHTNPSDRFLANSFYWLQMLILLTMLPVIFLY